MTCEQSHLDGAYVLGSLSPAERQDFERHLSGCDECSRAVRELAGLPGLLARVDPAVLGDSSPDVPVPDTLLPRLVASVSHERRRRRFVTVGLAAAAAVAVVTAGVGVPLAVSGAFSDGQHATAGGTTSSTPGQRMVPLAGAPVRAQLALQPVAWGTRLDLTCTYAPTAGEYQLPQVATYVLVVRTRDGRTEQVGTWKARDGRTMRLSAATSASRDQISSVEVRTTNGKAVLRLTA
jgi:hypothetical protein